MPEMSGVTVKPNAYQLLGVHPSAPGELMSAAYWMQVADLQKLRLDGHDVDAALHAVTRAYEMVADRDRRKEYDAAIGYTAEPLVNRPLPKVRRSLRGRLLRRPPPVVAGIDYYEVLGLDSAAPSTRAAEAYQIMRDYYLRVPDDSRRTHLLKLLEDAYRLVGDEVQRRRYDERSARKLKRAEQRPVATDDAGERQQRNPADSRPPESAAAAVADGTDAAAAREEPRPTRRRQREAGNDGLMFDAAAAAKPCATPSVDGAAPGKKPAGTPKGHRQGPALAPRSRSADATRPVLAVLARVLAAAASAVGRIALVCGRAAWAAARAGIARLAKWLRSSGGEMLDQPPATQSAAQSAGPKTVPGWPDGVEEVFLHRLASTVGRRDASPEAETDSDG